MGTLSIDLIWWITVIDLPAMAGLFWMIWRLRENLNNFKLEVAKTYASQADMRGVEKRLVEHLLRIESKLDTTALKTEGLIAHSKKGA